MLIRNSTSKHVSYEVILLSLYGLLIFAGLILNVSLASILLYRKLYTNITNCLILILAFSDILLCGICTPLQTLYEVFKKLPLNDWICKIVFAFFGMPLYISCLTVLLIAIDRYRMILHPLLPKMNRKCAVICVSGIILFSIVNCIPVAYYMEFMELKDGTQSYCPETWSSPLIRIIYSIHVPIFLVMIPLFSTTFLYYRIYAGLRRSRSNPRIRRSKLNERRSNRTNAILFCNVICIILCWLPWTLYSLILEINIYRSDPKSTYEPIHIYSHNVSIGSLDGFDHPNSFHHLFSVDLYLKMLSMLSTCINPILYGWINNSIRNKIK
uniref:NPYR-12 n=1 Tax=Schmidtea mediterranea TaxID=79327 RepID=A0A193KUH6_SCHMD|nr:NPYR-12 [Schmidtea mediterranea]